MITNRDEWYEAIHKLEEKYASENGKGRKLKSMIFVPDDDPLLKEVQRFSRKIIGDHEYPANFKAHERNSFNTHFYEAFDRNGELIASGDGLKELSEELKNKQIFKRKQTTYSIVSIISNHLGKYNGTFEWGKVVKLDSRAYDS
ncbi:hypothetical protein FC87_GL000716 [Fructilactobacillus florum DSM 22689 = JCM 16035]|uniref:Uncharacterized protein n=2 Tax=Fructilactobacillus florum TaxID=640331 RepID=A0A0R2CC89_9LACO|nr:hypothetical protein [Fructilactobacillus florum]KRM88944.1 hypothetical protein FC87_GL000716 [Fructilactobacillus florum DSM 22689 = JCM 16035]